MLEFVRLLKQVSPVPINLEVLVDHFRPFVLCCYPGLHEVRMLTNKFQAQHWYLLPTASVSTLNSTVRRSKSNAAICRNDSWPMPTMPETQETQKIRTPLQSLVPLHRYVTVLSCWCPS